MSGTGSQRSPDESALTTMAAQFIELAMALADSTDQPLVQQRLIDFAVRGIPGADHASLTLVEGRRRPRTTAQSDSLPYRWDQLQYAHGEGPCLDVISTNGFVLAQDLRTDTRWPRFAHALVTRTPVRSMLSFRLFLTEDNRAALNLYALEPGVFTDQSVATGSMFAAYSSMALLAAAREDRSHHLTRALESSREIGVAIGILMADGTLTQRQAFEHLATASQNLNRRLADIAEEVAATGELPAFARKHLR